MLNEELLTNEEMSALLPDTQQDGTAKDRDKRRRIVPYNFRRPDRLSKEQVRSLYLLHDLFAHTLSSSLPLFLRAASEVSLISVEQQPYSDYLRGLSDPTTIFTVAPDQLKGVFAIELNSSIAFPVIDRMLGGEGRDFREQRAATDLELSILEGFLPIVIDNYREAWKPLIEFETKVVGRETRPQLLQIVAANEVVATVVYQLKIGDAQGFMSICLPVEMIESVIKKFDQSSHTPQNLTTPEATHSLLKAVAGTRFAVAPELDRVYATVSDLMALAVGDVLRTNHSVDKPLNVCFDDAVKFRGRLAAVEGRLVVQVTDSLVEQDLSTEAAA